MYNSRYLLYKIYNDRADYYLKVICGATDTENVHAAFGTTGTTTNKNNIIVDDNGLGN